MRRADERYFECIERDLEEATAVARRARERGEDPVPDVEIPVAHDMADRVEKVLGIDGVADRVRELEGEMSREEAALELARDFAEGRVGDYETPAGKVEGAVRTAVALLTEGVVAAPIEGIDRVEVLESGDGSEVVRVFYAGPIRSAGGTAQALSVLVADYTRALVGLDAYEARESEVQRYVEELTLYDEETGLQYAPKNAETEYIARNCPVMLDGEATGSEEVSGFRDLERVNTNSPRGGMCLVLGEGIAQKAPKIKRYTDELQAVDWPWLDDLIAGVVGKGEGPAGTDTDEPAVDRSEDGEPTAGSVGARAAEATPAEKTPSSTGSTSGGSTGGEQPIEEHANGDHPVGEQPVGGPPRPEPEGKFLEDLIAGRPVLGYPSEAGGFRLRYGRARNHGFATAGVHPATMRLVGDSLATGTQLKTERPGKAAGVVPVDSIEGPTVKLATGAVRHIDDPDTALELRNGVDEILDLGEYLVNYGEFVENNQPLAPASYTVDWWVQDAAAAGVDVQALRDATSVDLADPAPDQALNWAREWEAPLHPSYTYLWHDLSVDQFVALARAIASGRWAHTNGSESESESGSESESESGSESGGGNGERSADATRPGHDDPSGRLIVPRTDAVCRALETLLVEHRQGEEAVTIPDALVLVRSLGLTDDLERPWSADDLSPVAREWADGGNAIRAVNEVAPFRVRERAPTRVGSRMGRPEKSEKREMSPPVHALFPIGNAGGDQRDVTDATRHSESMRDTPGEVDVELGRRACRECATRTFRTRCPGCGGVTDPQYECPDCEREIDPDESGRAVCPRCETDARTVETYTLDVHGEYRNALERVGERESAFDVLKGVKGLSSEHKVPEPLAKGVLRAKNGVSVFKDGTIRYDMTDLPVTSVRPGELGVTAEQFRELGYETDVHGDALTRDDQLVELKVQDVVLSEGAAEHMLQTGDFVDDLLVQYYDMAPFYEFEERDDLVGELVFGMAPHTSAAVIGRVVGFTSAAVGYAHPYFHAAKRRNCFHPDVTVHCRDEHGQSHSVSIRDFVEQRLADPREDDVGTLVQELDGSVRVSSIDDDGNTVVRPVEAVSKHPAPEHMVRVETHNGRSLTVTHDHEILRWNDGIERITAPNVEPGDELPVGQNTGPQNRHHTLVDGGEAGPHGVKAGPEVEIVERVQYVTTDVDYTYCLTVAETHSLFANEIATGQCDGDEDCIMLLMDGLLNFSKQYLPDNRGGSVAEDSRLVAVSPEGDVEFLTFEDFWDELDTEVIRDGKFRKKPCLPEGWKTYVFNEDHRASIRPIEKAIRYRASENETLLRVETQFGRSLSITANHSLFRYADGIEEVAGEDLREGDLLLAPRNLDVETVETTIDVTECIDEPYIVIDDTVEDLLTSARRSTKRGSLTHQAFRNGLSYRLDRCKIALEQFEEILATADFEGDLPDLKVCLPRSSTGIRRTLEVNEQFAWLLGLFVADGSLSSDNPCISNSDEELVKRAVGIANDVCGSEPEIRCRNRAYEIRFPAVFREVLYDLGFQRCDDYDSSEKVIPENILRAPRDVMIAFLRGFIAGDGSDRTDDNVTTVWFYTTSEDVKDGIVFLLHRLGLVADISVNTDRKGNRQPCYTVTVSGGANDNPLDRILAGETPYHPESLVVSIPDALMEIREMDVNGGRQLIDTYLEGRDNISLEKLKRIVDELEDRSLPPAGRQRLEELRPLVDGDLSYLRVKTIEATDYDGYLYDLQVGGEPIFTANWLYAHNSMDAPLVMSSRIDPTEIDDEAHNVDVADSYPREFYEATRRMADPGSVDIELAGETVGTDSEYTGFRHTHDTSDIAAGPDLSAYKTLEDMEAKMDAQLDLARKLRAVDESDVAERVIEYHFLPDLLGNLRAFSRQETRCRDCGRKYRRPPLSGDCRECGGEMSLTVYEGSVDKYMETARAVAEEFGTREYTKQRLEILERSLESIFQNDHNRQSGIADFM